MQDEMIAHQPQYEQFIQHGLAILEKTDTNTTDAEKINARIEAVNRGWDKLQSRLGERASALGDMQRLSTAFYDTLAELSDWLPGTVDAVENLPVPVGARPEVVAEQNDQLRVRICELQFTFCIF